MRKPTIAALAAILTARTSKRPTQYTLGDHALHSPPDMA